MEGLQTRQTDRQTDRQTTDRQAGRQTKTERQRQAESDRDRKREGAERERERHRQRQRQADRQTERERRENLFDEPFFNIRIANIREKHGAQKIVYAYFQHTYPFLNLIAHKSQERQTERYIPSDIE